MTYCDNLFLPSRDLIELDQNVSCELQNCYDFTNTEELNECIKREQVNCVLAIHAFRSGHLLPGKGHVL